MESSNTSETEDNCQRGVKRTLETHGVPFQAEKESLENSPSSSSPSSHTSSSSSSSHDSPSSNSPSLKRQSVEYMYTPTLLEKQIIRHSLAMICRANICDWNLAIDKSCTSMVLNETTVVVDEDVIGTTYNVYNEVSYGEDNTQCRVSYFRGMETKGNVIQYSWSNNFGDPSIHFSQSGSESYYLFFSRPVTRRLTLEPRDCKEDSWCYFQDARRHLNRISF